MKLNFGEKLNFEKLTFEKLNSDKESKLPTLIDYSDANWRNDVNMRRSMTGYIFYLSGGVISWSSKRQATVALSSTEAEYMVLTQATKEAIYMATKPIG